MKPGSHQTNFALSPWPRTSSAPGQTATSRPIDAKSTTSTPTNTADTPSRPISRCCASTTTASTTTVTRLIPGHRKEKISEEKGSRAAEGCDATATKSACTPQAESLWATPTT